MDDTASIITGIGGPDGHGSTVVKTGALGTGAAIFISTVGAGVFVLPTMTHRAGLVWTLVAMALFAAVGAVAARMVALASGIFKSPSYSEVIAIAVVGPECRTLADDGLVHPDFANASVEDRAMLSPHASHLSLDSFIAKTERDNRLLKLRRDARARRVIIEYALDALVYFGNVMSLVMFSHVISHTGSQLLRSELGATGFFGSTTFVYMLVLVLASFIGMLRSLSEMFATIVVGCVTVIVPGGAIAIAYFATNGGETFADEKARRDVRWWHAEFGGLCAMVSTVMISNCYHNVVPQIAREMSGFTIAKFGTVASVTAALMYVLMSLVAAFGYLTFGSLVATEKAAGMIMNLYPEHGFWAFMRFCIVLHVVCAMPVYLVNTRLGFYRLYRRVCDRVARWRRKQDEERARLQRQQQRQHSGHHDSYGATEQSHEDHEMQQQQQQQHAADGATPEQRKTPREMEEEGDSDIVAPVTLGKSVGYELPVGLRLAQSTALSAFVVGFAASISNVATITSWSGALNGPLLLVIVPALIAMRVYGGAWAGTQWVSQTGESKAYDPWRGGWWLGLAALVFGVLLQVLALLDQFGVFTAPPLPAK